MADGRSSLFPRKNSSEDLANWKKKFVNEDCDENLIDFVLTQNVIKNYAYLFQQFKHLPISMRKDIHHPWELFCLSGEPQAFDFAADQSQEHYDKKLDAEFHMTPTSVTRWRMNPLHYAALSGNPEQLQKAIDFGIDFTSTSCSTNILHFAALGGSVKMINLIIKLNTNRQLKLKDNKQRTPAHYAAAGGSLATTKWILNLKGIDIHDKDFYGHTVLDYAYKKGHEDITNYLMSIGLTLSKHHAEHSFGEPPLTFTSTFNENYAESPMDESEHYRHGM